MMLSLLWIALSIVATVAGAYGWIDPDRAYTASWSCLICSTIWATKGTK